MSSQKNQYQSLFRLLWQFWRQLNPKRQRQFIWLMVLMLVSAFAEVVSLGAVIPFLGILTAPEQLFKQPLVAEWVQYWGVTSPAQLVLPLTIMFIVVALVAAGIRMFLLWASIRLSYACGSDLSIEVYRKTLYQPYATHVARNSSEVISGITDKVGGAVSVITSALTFISSLVMVVVIAVTLIVIDPFIALIVTVSFGGVYALISWITRKILQRNSQRIAHEQTRLIKALQEGLGGIRDVLLDGTQSIYCDIYRKADCPLKRAQGDNLFIAGSPRYAMEAMGMVMIAVLAFFLGQQEGGMAAAIPVLGALALGAQRLLPALQQIYAAWASMVGYQASLAEAISLLDQSVSEDMLEPVTEPVDLQKSIRFVNVSFKYGQNGPWVLEQLNLTIEKGKRVGIVGSTGSGKSTLLDLLMGLLTPVKGEILIDSEVVTPKNVRAWQQSIAHVPQNIFLADTTLAENIAFGVPYEEIDFERVRKAAQQAQIEDFVESSPEGYNAIVGERGVRLSGGQRQRIGIARALYKQARVLVFDEATSALDNATEQLVMTAIDELSRDLTIILIAHRLSTVKSCDIVVELDSGRIAAQGTFPQLLERSSSFQRLAGHAG